MDRILYSLIESTQSTQSTQSKQSNTNNDNNIDSLSSLESDIYKKIEDTPNIFNLYLQNQVGGGEKEDAEKVKKFIELLEKYKELENLKLTSTDTNIETTLKEIKAQIESSTSTLEDIVGPSFITQKLPVILESIRSEGSSYKKLSSIRTLLAPEDNTKTILKPFQSAYRTFKETISAIKTDIKVLDLNDPAQVAKLVEKIAPKLAELKVNKSQIDELIKKYQDENIKYKTIYEVDLSLQKKETKIGTINFIQLGTSLAEADILSTYDGTDTMRINNENNPNEAIKDNITTFFKSTEKLRSPTGDALNLTIKKEELTQLIAPQFNSDGTISSKYSSKQSSIQSSTKVGGTIPAAYAEFESRLIEYKISYDNLRREINLYNFNQISIIMHMIYSFMVLTNSIFHVPNYIIYQYIGKGTINFYLRILTTMQNHFTDPRKNKKPYVIEMRKRHFLTIVRLTDFLTKIKKQFALGAKDKIWIDGSADSIRENFTLLNHFRLILEDYNVQNANKVSIYARINNIGFTTPDFNRQMYFSDHEKISYANKDSDIAELKALQEKLLSDPVKNKEKIEKIKNDIELINTPTIDDRLLWIQKNICTSYKTLSDDFPPIQSVKFTEVFDSDQYPSNDDISKYMSLANRINTGIGTCLITYGYSGTGKTYTLFGKGKDITKTSSNTIQGLLQSTLNDLNGLVGVHFRVFEIYGYGFTYPEYWTEGDAVRIDEIENNIISYKLDLVGSTIKPREDMIVEANKISTFIEENKLTSLAEPFYTINNSVYTPTNTVKGFQFIPGSKVKEVFANFETLTNDIDLIRKSSNKTDIKIYPGNLTPNPSKKPPPRRIRDTPNNKESSRSVLIYDFVIGIMENNKVKPVSFLIIDLPGRENIPKTFVDSFIPTPTTNQVSENVPASNLSDILRWGFNKDLKQLNTLIFNLDYSAGLAILKENVGSIRDEFIKKKVLNFKQKSTQSLENIINYCKYIDYRRQYIELTNGDIKDVNADIDAYNKQIKQIKQFKDNYQLFDVIKCRGDSNIYLKHIRLMLVCMSLYPLSVPILAEEIFESFIDDPKNKSVLTEIYDKSIKMNFKFRKEEHTKNINSYPVINFPYNKQTHTMTGSFTIYDEFINTFGLKINDNIRNKDGWKVNKRLHGYEQFYADENGNNKQGKIIFFIHLMNRLILLKKFDIINTIYQTIIDQKINNYIRLYLSDLNSYLEIKSLIDALLKDKFKGEYLKDEINKLTIQYNSDNEIYTVDHIFNLIKYDYNINGFEGIYINENINGLIQYLSDEKLVGTPNVEKPALQISKPFYAQQRDARLLLMSIGVQNADLTDLSQSQADVVLVNAVPGATVREGADQSIINAAAAFTQPQVVEQTRQKPRLKQNTEPDAMKRNKDNIISIFDLDTESDIIPNLFRSGMIYTSTKFQTTSTPLHVLDYIYDYIISQYDSSHIYSNKQPLIENILKPYLPQLKADNTMDFTTSRLVDFKMFYLFANYGKEEGKDELHELKCYQQNVLLQNTSKFIEAIYK